MLAHPGRGAVIKHHAIFAQHQAIAALAHGQSAEGVGIDLIQESARIGALNVDLAQRGHIANTDRAPGCQNLAVHAFAPRRLARFRHPLRAQPVADLDKDRALFGGPFVAGCQAEGFEFLAPRAACQCAHGNRRIGRAVDGGAGGGNGLAGEFGHHGNAQHIAGLALIGRHAQRGIAFQVFNGGEVFLVGQLHILDRHIVLLVDPRAALAFVDIPQGADRNRCIFGLRQIGGFGGEAQIGQRGNRLRLTCQQSTVGRERAICRPGCRQTSRPTRARHKGRDILAPFGARAVVRGDVHIRVPPARHAQGGAGNRLGLAIGQPHRHRFQAQATGRVHHLRALQVPDTGEEIAALTAVDHGGHIHALGLQVFGRAQPVIVVGEHRHAVARRDTPAVGIGAKRARQHDAGTVVVFKGNRPFGRAAREDGPFGIDAPQRLARLSGHRHCQMVRNPLNRGINPVVKGPDNRGAGHQADIRHCGQFCHHARRPIGTGLASNLMSLGVEPSTHAEIFVRQHNARARAPRRQCGHQPRRPGTDDQKIAMQEPLVVFIGVFFLAQRSKPRRTADDRFIDLFPKGCGPHEGLVIEPGGEKAVEPVIDRHGIQLKAGPGVLARGLQPVKQLCHRGARVRLLPCARAQMHQRVRLF